VSCLGSEVVLRCYGTGCSSDWDEARVEHETG
jgi:hypothetical protein